MTALSNTPVAAKILGVVGLLAALTLGVTFFALSNLAAVDATYTTLLGTQSPATLNSYKSARAAIGVSRNAWRYAGATTPEAESEARQSVTRFIDQFNETSNAAAAALPSLKDGFERQQERFRKLSALIPALENAKRMGGLTAAAQVLQSEIDPLVNEIRDGVDTLARESEAQLATASAEAHDSAGAASTTMLIASLAGIALVSAAAAAVAIGAVARPLKQLSEGIQKLAAGDASATFAKGRRDEIGRIETALADLQVTLRQAFTLKQMVEEMPINVMTCDPKNDFKIDYMNKESLRVLRTLEQFLPRRADEIVGQSFDIFHKNPGHQRAIVSDPGRLPWNAKIKLGPETLDLRVSAIRDNKGAYVGPMVTWSVVTKQVKLADDFEANVMGVVHAVSRSAEAMQVSASTMTATAEETSRQSTTVASAAEQATSNVQTVAAAAEELTSSVNEISRQVAESANVARQAVQEAQRTNVQVTGLADAAQKIGDVVRLISDIAAQTNLLALNATIEAARAGEAGKGFAVVASEVKSLANQTARATEEIGAQISSIQSATTDAVSAINGIGQTIQRIDAIASTIAAAVEEQGAATREISRNVQEAATGTGEVSSNIVQVSKAAESSGEAAAQVVTAAEDLTGQSARLKGEVEKFLSAVRAA